MLPYIKLFTDMSETVDLLTDAEAGRLIKALLHFANGVDEILPGQERLIYSMLKAQIGRDEANYTNGMKGGRPKKGVSQNKTPLSKTKTPLSQEEEKEEDEEEDQDEEKNKKLDDDNAHMRESPFGEIDVDPVIVTIQTELIGLTYSHYEELEDFRKDLGDELIIEAVNEAVAHGNRTWAYVRTILNNYIRDGVKTVGEARASSEKHRQKNVPAGRGPKVVNAQQYEQRKYTEAELDAVSEGDRDILRALEAKYGT